MVRGDLGDREAVVRALRESGADTVLHFAACAYVGESMADPGKYFRNNVANTLNLMEAADRAREVLGWVPQYPDVEDMIRHAWEWEGRRDEGGELKAEGEEGRTLNVQRRASNAQWGEGRRDGKEAGS